MPADPTPIINARPENFEIAATNFRAVSRRTVYDKTTGIPIPSTTLRVTQDCQNRTVYPIGIPSGETQNAVMPYNGATQTAYGIPLQLLSVTSNGTATVQVTCSAPHGLHTDNQVSIEGLANRYANGFYSVTVFGATTFAYMTYGSIPAMALLTPTTRIITALIGLPRGYTRIPKLWGPPLTFASQNVCFLETESGGMFLLENGSGYIQLESCNQTPPVVCLLEQENGSGMFLLENGTGYIQLQNCAQPTSALFELETGTGNILLQNGVDFLELEDGP